MIENKRTTPADWVDPDDAPELDAHFFEHAEVAIGDRVIRPATDTMAKRGRGRPPVGKSAKVQQTLKLSPEVLEHFRSTGEGWQARIDEALQQARIEAELRDLPAMARMFDSVRELGALLRLPTEDAANVIGAAAHLRDLAGGFAEYLAMQDAAKAKVEVREQPPETREERPLTLFEKMMNLSRGPAKARHAGDGDKGVHVQRDARTGRYMDLDADDGGKSSGRRRRA